MEEVTLDYGQQKIKYYLTRKKVKNINVNVKADGKVFVSANFDVSRDIIDRFIIKKSRWILRHLNTFEKTKEIFYPPREYVSGENYNFLGKQYRLKLEESVIERVEKPSDGYLKLFVKDKDDLAKKRNLINKWYQSQIKLVLSERFNYVYNKFLNFFGGEYNLRIRAMKTRWGTCNAKSSVITLNSNLIFAPEYCIEYVVLPELCHFKYSDHSKQFYELLENLMPDWELRKKILDEETARFISIK